MISNQKIELHKNNKIRFEWSWNIKKGEMNVYLEKFRNRDLEYLGKISITKECFYESKDYEIGIGGIYRIIAFPVINSIEDKAHPSSTNYINVGRKNILEYYFGEEKELNCKYIYIKRLDVIIMKEVAYFYSVKDDIKIPFTSDLKQGEKYYISDFEDIKIELEYPYNLGVDIRLV